MSEQPPEPWRSGPQPEPPNWMPQQYPGGQQPVPPGYPPQYGPQPQYGEPQYGQAPYGQPQYGQYPTPGQPPFGAPPPEPPRRSHPLRWTLVGLVSAAVVGVAAWAVATNVGDTLKASSACSDSGIQQTLASRDVPSGFTTIPGEHGLAVAVPGSFQNFELTQQNIDQTTARADPDSPEGRVATEAKRLVDNHGVLLAADYDNGDNVNIIRTPGPAHCALPKNVAAEARRELSGANVTGLNSHPVVVGGRRGLEMRYRFPGQDDVIGAQVYVPGEHAVYILTVTASELSEQDVDAVLTSLRFAD